jgi:membrane protein required for colicin V production
VIAGFGAIHGIFKGFILSVTSLLGLILGYYFSIRFAWYIEAVLRESTGSNSPFMHIIAFVLCYLLVIIIVYVIGRSIQKTIEFAALGCFNRMAGAILWGSQRTTPGLGTYLYH